MKNSLLIHYFLVNLVFFPWDLCVLKMYHVRFYIVENRIWNDSQTMWDSFQTSDIIAKNFPFLCLWNPSYVCRSVLAYECFGPRMQAATHVHRSRATLVILFPKIDFYLFKMLYFPFWHFSSQFNIWLDSKLALGFRVRAS